MFDFVIGAVIGAIVGWNFFPQPILVADLVAKVKAKVGL